VWILWNYNFRLRTKFSPVGMCMLKAVFNLTQATFLITPPQCHHTETLWLALRSTVPDQICLSVPFYCIICCRRVLVDINLIPRERNAGRASERGKAALLTSGPRRRHRLTVFIPPRHDWDQPINKFVPPPLRFLHHFLQLPLRLFDAVGLSKTAAR
jgi:hypothetical protein